VATKTHSLLLRLADDCEKKMNEDRSEEWSGGCRITCLLWCRRLEMSDQIRRTTQAIWVEVS
jgi:hypothetical protein